MQRGREQRKSNASLRRPKGEESKTTIRHINSERFQFSCFVASALSLGGQNLEPIIVDPSLLLLNQLFARGVSEMEARGIGCVPALRLCQSTTAPGQLTTSGFQWRASCSLKLGRRKVLADVKTALLSRRSPSDQSLN